MPNDDNPETQGISGGLDLITLLRLGAVSKIRIDKQKERLKGDKDFREIAKMAIYDAYFSIYLKVLKPFVRNAREIIMNWKPIEDLTELAFAGKSTIFQGQ